MPLCLEAYERNLCTQVHIFEFSNFWIFEFLNFWIFEFLKFFEFLNFWKCTWWNTQGCIQVTGLLSVQFVAKNLVVSTQVRSLLNVQFVLKNFLIFWIFEFLNFWIFETLKLWNFEIFKLWNFQTLKFSNSEIFKLRFCNCSFPCFGIHRLYMGLQCVCFWGVLLSLGILSKLSQLLCVVRILV